MCTFFILRLYIVAINHICELRRTKCRLLATKDYSKKFFSQPKLITNAQEKLKCSFFQDDFNAFYFMKSGQEMKTICSKKSALFMKKKKSRTSIHSSKLWWYDYLLLVKASVLCTINNTILSFYGLSFWSRQRYFWKLCTRTWNRINFLT